MRLIWKKYDSKFDPIVTLVGLGFVGGGIYGIAILSPALRRPLSWVIATLPFLAAVMGILTLAREYQLWKQR